MNDDGIDTVGGPTRIAPPNRTAIGMSLMARPEYRRRSTSAAIFPSRGETAVRNAMERMGHWLPVLIAALVIFVAVLGRLSMLKDQFIYPPAAQLQMPPDKQLEPQLMATAVPGYDAATGSDAYSSAARDESQAVAPPENLSRFESLKLTTYTVKPGDSISGIAKKFGIDEGTIISFNDINDVRRIPVGASFQIPNKNGLRYTVHRGDSLSSIAGRFNTSVNSLLDTNNMKSTVLHVGQDLFVPGAKMSTFQLQLVLGEAFQWPVRGAVMTSTFGIRRDPFTGARDFHPGIDLALYFGAPIHAAGNGVVKDAGYNNIFGYYIIISHPNSFQTLYGHLSKQLVHSGQSVVAGQTIGLMGSTGYSTGTHLHFGIYHNYKPVNPLKYLPKQ